MAEELCYCGLRLIEAENASYQIDGAACCSRQCYNEGMAASHPLDRDGYMWGGPGEKTARLLH